MSRALVPSVAGRTVAAWAKKSPWLATFIGVGLVMNAVQFGDMVVRAVKGKKPAADPSAGGTPAAAPPAG